MKKRNRKIFIAICAAAVLGIATAAMTIDTAYWDIYGMNGLLKGYLRVESTADFNGDVDLTGATPYNAHWNTALLSGTTGDITWGVDTSGNSGWHLSTANLQTYQAFFVESNSPGGLVSGASQYSDAAYQAQGATGVTIYLPAMDATLRGMEWTFTNAVDGVTPFFLYSPDSQLKNLASGTTHAPKAGGFDTGVTTIPKDLGDSVTVKAIATPTAVSGYYVTDVKVGS